MINKIRILYVEDDVVMGMEVKELLEGAGYEVCDMVSSGSAAILGVRSHKPDIVIMDIRLKGRMDGIETTRRIRSFSGVPVIFLSGYRDAGMVKESLAMMNTVFISKPYDPGKLIAAIASFNDKDKKHTEKR